MQALREEVQRQALLLAESQQRSVEPLIESGSYRELQAVVDRFQNHERLSGAAVYNAAGKPVAVTPGLAAQLSAAPPAVALALQKGGGRGEFTRLQNESMHVFALPLRSQENRVIGAIAIFHNVAYMDARRAAVWRHALAGVAVQMLLIALITMLIVRWSLGKPLQKMAHWLHDLRTGKVSMDGGFPNEEIFQPLAHEATRLATSLNAARAAAEEEARLRESAQALWTAERLRISVENTLKGSRLFVVSNREPYEHVREGNSIAWSVPPSGLVTALEPVLRACDELRGGNIAGLDGVIAVRRLIGPLRHAAGGVGGDAGIGFEPELQTGGDGEDLGVESAGGRQEDQKARDQAGEFPVVHFCSGCFGCQAGSGGHSGMGIL